MSNIVSMPQPGGASERVIERLEEALEMAKKGCIANLCIVMVDFDDNVYHGWANGNRPTLIIGELHCAAYEFMIENTQRRGE
jgi:hypothetical protein